MTDATLQAFRDIAESMQTEPTDWQWIGPHMSQRMFGITRTRAEGYAKSHGGDAKPMVAPGYASSETAYGRTVGYDFAVKVF